MGLLDDAIREHLELKRRHGADPTDLAKLEREAFGPIRRGAEAPESAEAQVEAAEPPPRALQPDPEPVPEFEPAPPRDVRPAEPEPVDPVLTEPEVDPPGPAPAAEEEITWDEPAPPSPQETRAFDAAEVAEAEGRRATPAPAPAEPVRDEDDDDVLEETPEFLQETPEHDRLWFEQRPPRDFDFDG